MKRIACIILIGIACLPFFSTPVSAQTQYIREIIYVTLREGPGVEHKVFDKLQSGQALEVLQAGDEWTKVRVPGGSEGWVLSRYVTSQQPSSNALAILKKQHEALKAKLASWPDEKKQAQAEFQNIDQENQRLRKKLDDSYKQLKQVKQSYAELKRASAGYLELKTKYEKTMAQLAGKKKEAAKYQKALEKLEFRNHIKWFLSGAGVIVFGFIIGFSARPRRKSSLR